MNDVVVDRFGEDLGWVETTSAKRALYQAGRWLFQDGIWRTKSVNEPNGVREQSFAQKWVDIPEKPEDFGAGGQRTDDMNLARSSWTGPRGLGVWVRRRTKNASPWHMRMALPLAM